MDGSTTHRTVALALALVMIGGMLPLSTVGASHHPDCKLYNHETIERITMSDPLSGRFTANELVYFVGDKDAGEDVNGLDGYVLDIGCETSGGSFTLDVTEPASGFEIGLRFYDDTSEEIDEWSLDRNEDIEGFVPLPDGTRYVVVYMEDGPLLTGFSGQHSTLFYSLEFAFEAAP